MHHPYSPSPSPAPPTSPQHHAYQSQAGSAVNGAGQARYSLLNKLQHGHFAPSPSPQQQQQQQSHHPVGALTPPFMTSAHPVTQPFYSNSNSNFANGGGHLHHSSPSGPPHHLSQLNLNNSNANNSSPHASSASSASMSPHIQLQMSLANVSRSNNQPHHHARIAHLANRGVGLGPSAAVAILNPNRPSPATTKANGHSKHDIAGTDSDPARSASAASMRTGSSFKDKDAASPTTEAATISTDKESNWSTLDMGGMSLKNVSLELFRYTFLTVLYLPHNAISTLPSAIARMTNLTTLDLSSNKLSSLPAELGLLTNLRDLLLFDNYLTSLPPELGTLYLLETFGIEGNPLPENIRSLVEKDGTAALIAYLRDSCPVPLPPPERDWISIEETLPSANEQKTESFSLLSYNILCEKYATPQMYGYTPSWALGWEYRKELIMQEILNYAADIICLQEVDGKQYEEFFLETLGEQEYDGVYYPKSRARTMSGEEKRQVDGCATFFKNTAFALVETHNIEFNQIAMRRPDFKKTEDMFNRVMTKDNIAIITLLENRQSGARLIVANVHTTWDPEFRDVKLVQVAMLMDELRRIADDFARLPSRLNLGEGYDKAPTYSNGTKIPTIVCGDFNSEPDSGVYEFLTRGNVAPDHADFMSHVYGTYTSEGLAHRFSLRSAYSHVGELPLTNYTPDFYGAIDHVFYSTNSLAVTGLLGEIDKDYLSHVVGFPNAHFPSDHVSILTEFKIK